MNDQQAPLDAGRREFMRAGLRAVAAAAVSGLAAGAVLRGRLGNTVWQIDPRKCMQCGRCATNCVLTPSAVKCVHQYSICGYCDLCGGYHRPEARSTDTSAENQLCPVGAIRRRFIEDPYYQYTIDEHLCVGCAKCVKGCESFGNGSLFLQIRHDRCVNCNECSIARACPAGAVVRVPSSRAYLIKGDEAGAA